jgi:hypothetical protein
MAKRRSVKAKDASANLVSPPKTILDFRFWIGSGKTKWISLFNRKSKIQNLKSKIPAGLWQKG